MGVPPRYARHITVAEWQFPDLDGLGPDCSGLVVNVLNAICSVEPTDEEDRRRAMEATIRYARALAGGPDLTGITEAGTEGAINLARLALDGLRGAADEHSPDRPADADGEEPTTQ